MKRTAAQILAENVKRIRDGYGESQFKFGRRCGVSQRVISNIEHGGEVSHSRLDVIENIASGVGITVDSLFIEQSDASLESFRRCSQAAQKFARLRPDQQQRVIELLGDFMPSGR